MKTRLTITDMACGMCEAHVNDAIRKAFPVKKVKSSHRRNLTEIVSDGPLDEQRLREVIAASGYTLTDIETIM
ncbi:MAG: heavy-metal-associated domain-containing protein [Firmicutes bacterium]|nr:heavy-metal-associated domain-containing protein [Bacillota bacterium]MBR3212676.1 heavy-metal-associated domain-containing protein [Bacillota bacterium]